MTQSPRITVVAAIIQRDGRFLLTRRLEGTHLAGCWEFPGGKCDAGESHAECLTRELREELDVNGRVGALVLSTTHAYPERTVELHFYETALQGEPRPMLGQQMRWVEQGELGSLEMPEADAALIDLLSTRTS